MTAHPTPQRDLQEACVAAILGTDRANNSPTAAPELLTRAALAHARLRAGRAPGANATAIPPCPHDLRPVATPHQSMYLERALADENFFIINEWCELANLRGVRIPPGLIPEILAWWRTQPRRSDVVVHAAGATGLWLASLNPRWRDPVKASRTAEIPVDLEERWQTETGNERCSLLRAVVGVDPRRAIDLIRSTWSDDGAEDRRRFIETLARGIDPLYEPLLESALDDRSKTVRREAARVLTMLPGSALRGRMNQRVASLVQVQRSKGLLRKEKISLSVEPPKEFDATWERDAIEEQATVAAGKRAHWMRQLIAASDLSVWTSSSGLDPAGVVAALHADDYWNTIYYAMVESLANCPTQADTIAWCMALIHVTPGSKTPDYMAMARVSHALPLAQSEQLRLAFAPVVQNHVAMWMIAATDDRPWSRDYSSKMLAHLRQATPVEKDPADLRPWIQEIAHKVHTTSVDTLEQIVKGIYPGGLTPKIQECLDRARMRADMHKEFNA